MIVVGDDYHLKETVSHNPEDIKEVNEYVKYKMD